MIAGRFRAHQKPTRFPVKVAFDLALAGDFPMWKALFDRIDGLPKNRQPRTEDLTYWLSVVAEG